MMGARRLGVRCLLSLVLAGCGRLGFEPADPFVALPSGTDPDAGVLDEDPDSGTAPSDDDDDDVGDDQPPADAGTGNGKVEGKGGYDGGSFADSGMPAEPFLGDAGVFAVGDGGTGSSFSCADYPSALACATFEQGAPDDWYVDDRSPGQTPQFYDGIVDTQTNGSGSDSYVSADFANRYSGSLYFRLRVMFPSDGDLSSVNFITVGNYEDESDYGVELDAIDGKLAFNSSSDGFTYTSFALARDQWLCIDARIVLSDGDGSMSARVDGAPALDVRNVDTVPYSGTTLVDIGIDWTRRPEGYAHVLVDEFVLSRDPVACP
jgi:hypothetical protein